MQWFWRRTWSSHLSTKIVLNMFYRIEVWRLSWPFHSLQTLTLNIIINKHSSVRSGIIIHQNKIAANSSSIWPNIGHQGSRHNISHQSNFLLETHEDISVTTERDFCPNHDTTTFKIVSFNNVGFVLSRFGTIRRGRFGAGRFGAGRFGAGRFGAGRFGARYLLSELFECKKYYFKKSKGRVITRILTI